MGSTLRKRSARDIRSESRLDVLHALLTLERSNRNELARRTGLSLATVATIVTELLSERLLIEAGTDPNGAGRPTTLLRINSERGRILGIDVAETYVRGVVFDAALGELGSAQVSIDEIGTSVGDAADAVIASVNRALAETGTSRSELLGAGLSLPGFVRGDDATPMVPHWAWRNVELVRLVRDRLGVPLVVENPLKAIASAELWLGVGREASSVVIANLGTGVGVGIALDGRILRGANGAAGEWGHSLLSLDGRLCRCGRRGCVEAYVGAPGIQETLRELSPTHPLTIPRQADFIQEFAAALGARDPDPVITETFARTARYLGYALADLVAILNPEMLRLTGWTAWALGEQLVGPTRAALLERVPGVSAQRLELGVSTVRGNSAAIGMAILAFERFLGDVGLTTNRLAMAL